MKKIVLITCALKCEYDTVKQYFLKYETPKLKFTFLLTWVGNYQTLFTLQEYLRTHPVDFVINIWVCGCVKKEKESFFQVYRIYNLAAKRESLVPLYFILGSQKSIASSEQVITKKQDMENELYVDMESYAIDFVCTKLKTPYAIFKLPFDVVSSKSKGVSTQKLSEIMNQFPYGTLIQTLEIFFSTHQTQQINLEKYKETFSFTHAEFEIFKKLYIKWIALKKDFKKFFTENKHLNKTEFLKKMKEMN